MYVAIGNGCRRFCCPATARQFPVAGGQAARPTGDGRDQSEVEDREPGGTADSQPGRRHRSGNHGNTSTFSQFYVGVDVTVLPQSAFSVESSLTLSISTAVFLSFSSLAHPSPGFLPHVHLLFFSTSVLLCGAR